MSEQIKQESPTKPSTVDSDTGPALPEETKTNTKLLVGMIVGVLIIVAIIVLIVALLYSNPGPTAVIRDIFIIALALVSFAIGILLLVLVFQLQSLIALLRNEIKPMLTNANQTVNAVRGTAVFVSDNLVKPTIGFASFVAGLKGIQQAFTQKVNSAGRRSKPGGKAQTTSGK